MLPIETLAPHQLKLTSLTGRHHWTVWWRGPSGSMLIRLRRNSSCGGYVELYRGGGAIVEGSWRPDVPRSRDEWPSAASRTETTMDLGDRVEQIEAPS